MPIPYIVLHLLLALLAGWAAVRLPKRFRLGLGGVGLLIILLGFWVERQTELAWGAMQLAWPDLVFFTNFSLQGVVALAVLMARQATSWGARVRAGVLGLLVTGAALWSYAWYFAPVPASLAGRVNAEGFCRQTSSDSCSAAAAVTLLHRHSIPATEAEMAQLCLTRERHGTSPLGLYRGLALRCRGTGIRPRLRRLDPRDGMHTLDTPGIVSVGIRRNAPREATAQLEEYGWEPGVRHAVVVFRTDPQGRWIEVADPSYGKERWPLAKPEDLEYLWDGQILVLEGAPR